MKTKLLIVLLICTALLVSLNGFCFKGASGLVPSEIPDSLVWQIGPDADAYLDSKTLYIVGGTTWDLHNEDHISFAEWRRVRWMPDTVIVDVAALGHLVVQGMPPVKYIRVTNKVQSVGQYNFYDLSECRELYAEPNCVIHSINGFNGLWSMSKITLPKGFYFNDSYFGYGTCEYLDHIIFHGEAMPGWSDGAYYPPGYPHKTYNVWLPPGTDFNNWLNWPGRTTFRTYNKMRSINLNEDASFNFTSINNNPSNTMLLIRWEYDGNLINIPNLGDFKTWSVIHKADTPFITGIKAFTWEGIQWSDSVIYNGKALKKYRRTTEVVLNETLVNNLDTATLNINTVPAVNDMCFIPANPDSAIFNVINTYKFKAIADTFGTWPITATSWEGLTATSTVRVLSTNTESTISVTTNKGTVNWNPHSMTTSFTSKGVARWNFTESGTNASLIIDHDESQVQVQAVPRHSVSQYHVRYRDYQGNLRDASNGVVLIDSAQFEVPLEVEVQSEHQALNGEQGQIYNLTIIPDSSTNAKASHITAQADDNEYKVIVHPDTLEYNIDIPYEHEFIELQAHPAHPRAPQTTAQSTQLKVGVNEIVLTVQAQKTGIYHNYIVRINRASPPPPELSTLSIQDTDIPLTTGQFKYNINVPYETSRIQVQAEPTDNRFKVSGTGMINLNVGQQQIPITVVGLESMAQIYRLNVTRESSPTSIPNINQDIPVDVYTLTSIYLGKFTVSGLGRLKMGLKKHKVVILKTNDKVLKVKI